MAKSKGQYAGIENGKPLVQDLKVTPAPAPKGQVKPTSKVND